MIYVSERIVNISELEALIQNAKLNFEVLAEELQKEVSLTSIINGTTQTVRDSLEKAEKFEFLVEKRKCSFKAPYENQKFVENHLKVHSSD